MGNTATARVPLTTVLLNSTVLVGLSLFAAPVNAQTPADWRHIGNSLIQEDLAGPASGPVEARLVFRGRQPASGENGIRPSL